jgi:hypothetical protein
LAAITDITHIFSNATSRSSPCGVDTSRSSTGLCSADTFRCLSSPCGVDTFRSSTGLCSSLFSSPPPPQVLGWEVWWFSERFVFYESRYYNMFTENTLEVSVNGTNTLKVMHNEKWCGLRRWKTLGIVLAQRRSLNFCCLLFFDIIIIILIIIIFIFLQTW